MNQVNSNKYRYCIIQICNKIQQIVPLIMVSLSNKFHKICLRFFNILNK